MEWIGQPWLIMTPVDLACLWIVSLSRAKQGKTASICDSTVSNAYPEMKQYSTTRNSECYSIIASSLSSVHTDKRWSEQILANLRLLCMRVHMCNIFVLSEKSFHNNDISTVNAKMVKLFCVKRKFLWNEYFLWEINIYGAFLPPQYICPCAARGSTSIVQCLQWQW